jgi:YqaJ-like viral recombinase domain
MCFPFVRLNKNMAKTNPRKYPKLFFSKGPFEECVDPRVLSVFSMKQYPQRTKGWYEARKKCITASAASSTLLQSEDSCGAYMDYYNLRDSFKMDVSKTCSHKETQMEFILSKCGLGPKFTGNEYTRWGQKYEPIVSNIYSQIHQVDMLEFGLIPHPTIDFLGASPDGISTQGTMLEIKCPPCRQVTNYPPIYYWIQMILQLLCTNLQRCDYFDAHFVEYLIDNDWERDARKWEQDHPDAKHHIFGIILSYESNDRDAFENDANETNEIEETDEDDADEDEAEGEGEDEDEVGEDEVEDDGEIKERYIYADPNIVKIDDFVRWRDEMIVQQLKRNRECKPVYYSLHEYYISKAEVDHEWFKKNLPSMEAVWNQVIKGRTEEGDEILKQYMSDKNAALEDKRSKKREKVRRDAELSMYIDLDVSKGDGIQRGVKATYLHETCLL